MHNNMKQICIIILLNTIPFWAVCALYPTGAMVNWILYIIFQLILTMYNFRVTKKFTPFFWQMASCLRHPL